MITIETKDLKISKELKKKVDLICRFTCTTPTYENGKIKNLKGTNLAYVRPHIITISKIKYLMFDECDHVFVNGYKEKIQFKDLENYIKTH